MSGISHDMDMVFAWYYHDSCMVLPRQLHGIMRRLLHDIYCMQFVVYEKGKAGGDDESRFKMICIYVFFFTYCETKQNKTKQTTKTCDMCIKYIVIARFADEYHRQV